MGKGRKPGSVNKNTAALKDMILTALDKAGGVDYLVSQAEANPGPFMTLVGKVLPMTVAGDKDNPVTHHHVLQLSDEALAAIARG